MRGGYHYTAGRKIQDTLNVVRSDSEGTCLEHISPNPGKKGEKKQTEKQSETLKDLTELKKLNPDSAVETASDKQTSLHCVSPPTPPPPPKLRYASIRGLLWVAES